MKHPWAPSRYNFSSILKSHINSLTNFLKSNTSYHCQPWTHHQHMSEHLLEWTCFDGWKLFIDTVLSGKKLLRLLRIYFTFWKGWTAGDAWVQPPFQTSKMVGSPQWHVGWPMQRWPWTLIHMHRCNGTGQHGHQPTLFLLSSVGFIISKLWH